MPAADAPHPVATPWEALPEELCRDAEAQLAAKDPKNAHDGGKRRQAPFWYDKLTRETARNWDLFYKRNETRFFKDRHWVLRECPALVAEIEAAEAAARPCVLLEVGCGVGNLVFPLLAAVSDAQRARCTAFACDLSPRAVEMVRSHSEFDPSRMHAFVGDITNPASFSPENVADPARRLCPDGGIAPGSVDVISAVFVLSAIPPAQHVAALRNLLALLRPGGLLFFRDYARYDGAQLRFSAENKMDDHFYARQDGTLAYFFTREDLEGALAQAGACTLESCQYMVGRLENRRLGSSIQRIFLQCDVRRRRD